MYHDGAIGIAVMTVHVVQGGDGLARRAFSAADVRRMVESGILSEDERVELIDGELIAMSAKGFAHDRIKTELVHRLFRALSDDYRVHVESTLQLDAAVLVEPDLLVARKEAASMSAEGFATIPVSEVLLLIEVAATSLAWDRGRKAALYARAGVPEYWVIDANERTAWVHRGSGPSGYASVAEVRPHERLEAAAPELSGFGVRLEEL
jgi:Uma2 family endonuclease